MTDSATMTSEAGFEVSLPSGATTRVLTLAEVAYVNDKCTRYFEHNHIENVSDIQDIDRLIRLELLCSRYSDFLNRGGLDYFDKPVDETELRRSLTHFSSEVRQLKKIIGIDKATREHERGEASVSAYLAKLRERAREFGIHRDRQSAKVIELGMQLIALADYHDRCTEEERKELGITLNDLKQWITGVFKPEFMALDEHFRETNQKMWVRDL